MLLNKKPLPANQSNEAEQAGLSVSISFSETAIVKLIPFVAAIIFGAKSTGMWMNHNQKPVSPTTETYLQEQTKG